MKKTSKKDKYDVVRHELDLELIQWYDYYDYYEYDYREYYEISNFSYVKEKFYKEVISGSIFRRTRNQYLPYQIVDMNSIYSKQDRRNKLIDELLGYSNPKISYKPTFEDLLKNKNNNEKDK